MSVKICPRCGCRLAGELWHGPPCTCGGITAVEYSPGEESWGDVQKKMASVNEAERQTAPEAISIIDEALEELPEGEHRDELLAKKKALESAISR
jgi:hypothetical protein